LRQRTVERARKGDDEITACRRRRFDAPRLDVDRFAHRIGDADGARQLISKRSATRIAHRCVDFDGDSAARHQRRAR